MKAQFEKNDEREGIPVSFVQDEDLQLFHIHYITAFSQQELLDSTRSPDDNISIGLRETFQVICWS